MIIITNMASNQSNLELTNSMANSTAESTDSMDLTPNTLKRNPKNLDLSKNDLLQLLSQVEAELEAREVALAVLKSDKAKQLLYQAKYGRFSLGDPFLSLQRDSDSQKDHSFDEAAVKAMYDNQLVHLENLIATQRMAQQRMREQLIAVEKRFHKVCAELDEEKKKHAQDTAQGDDVTYMLEKDRERLKLELEAEKVNVKKVEKELKKTKLLLTEQQDISARHKQVAVVLIKERKELVKKLVEVDQAKQVLEQALEEASSHIAENHKLEQMEAMLERHLMEFDLEREQYRVRLAREESRNNELIADIERLSLHIEQLQLQLGMKRRSDSGPQNIEIKPLGENIVSPASRGLINQVVTPGSRVVTPGSLSNASAAVAAKMHPAPTLVTFRGTPPHTPPETRRTTPDMHDIDGTFVPPTRLSGNQEYLLKQAGADLAALRIDNKPLVPAKPAEMVGPRMTVVTPQGTGVLQYSSSSNTTVFTTPSGTRISLNVGPSPNQTRKAIPVTRGMPPPVPPNKPQIQIAPGQKSITSMSHTPGEKPMPPPRFVGISPPKDKSPKPSESGDERHASPLSNSVNTVTSPDGNSSSARKSGAQVLVK